MTPEAKLALISLPTVAAIEPRWAIAMALGMLGGWLARAGFSVKGQVPWLDIKRDLIVSVLISGGSIITAMTLAHMAEADELGVATIGFVVAFAGTDAITLLKDYVFAPIVNSIRNSKGPD